VLVGHEAIRAELEQALSPVTLLLGPRSVGKTTLAHHLIVHYQCRWSFDYGKLTATMAREIVNSSPIRRTSLDIRVIDLDGSTEAAQNILLKVLEEPPAHCRFILIASALPLPTVVSRSQVHRVGLLTDEQVAQVLRENCGISSEHAAAMAAARSRGQVAPAIAAAEHRESDRIISVVSSAVRAAAQGHMGAISLSMALRNWTDEHTVVLRRWATEAASGRWVIFTPDFAPGIRPTAALRVLEALSRYPGTRTGPAAALSTLRPKLY
jgi:DNA polymerase III delta prime subunit